MFKLTIISGPSRGTSYALKSGENIIGRGTGSDIHLQSAKVSKRHCVLMVVGQSVTIKDEGSANGTFVNGVLCKGKSIRSGDRINVGEFMLELIRTTTKPTRAAPVLGAFNPNNVVQFPVVSHHPNPPLPAAVGGDGYYAHGAPDPVLPDYMPAPQQVFSPHASVAPPQSLLDKLKWTFEERLMPLFYDAAKTQEWRFVALFSLVAFIGLNTVLTISPLLEESRKAIIKEAGRRAQYIAHEIAERNRSAMKAGAETKVTLGDSIKRDAGIRIALVVDLENRIIAPTERLNQTFGVGPEAKAAHKAAHLFRKGKTDDIVGEVVPGVLLAIVPIQVYIESQVANVTVGMAVVSLDANISLPGMGETGTIYGEVFLLSGLLGVLIFLILYRFTLRPFQVLNDDIDKVLKGDLEEISRPFKFEEISSLLDNISSALKRVPKGDLGNAGMFGASASSISLDDFVPALRVSGDTGRFGLLICDHEKRLVHLNSIFEDISGIRAEGALGQEIQEVSRDQAFTAFCADLFERAQPGSHEVSDDFEFSGTLYRVSVIALGTPNGETKGYAMFANRSEG